MGSDELPDIPSHFIVETFITSMEERDTGISQQHKAIEIHFSSLE